MYEESMDYYGRSFLFVCQASFVVCPVTDPGYLVKEATYFGWGGNLFWVRGLIFNLRILMLNILLSIYYVYTLDPSL